MLRDCVQQYISQHVPSIDQAFDIFVQVYSNLGGLSKLYIRTGVHRERDDLNRFIQGFNMSHGLMSIVDGGSGKECADVKMRGP